MEDLMVLLGIVWIGVAWLWEQLQALARFVLSPEGFRLVVLGFLYAIFRAIGLSANGLWHVMHRVDGTLEKQHWEQQKARDRLIETIDMCGDRLLDAIGEVRSLGEQLASPPWQDDLAEMRLILDDIRTLLQEAESDRRAKEL